MVGVFSKRAIWRPVLGGVGLNPWPMLLFVADSDPASKRRLLFTLGGDGGLTDGGVQSPYGSLSVEGGRRRVRPAAALLPRGVDATMYGLDVPRSRLQHRATATSLPAF